VALINGASAANVYWQAEGAVGTGANSTFRGTILTAGAITLGDSTKLIGAPCPPARSRSPPTPSVHRVSRAPGAELITPRLPAYVV
jgi:hypothetical protein